MNSTTAQQKSFTGHAMSAFEMVQMQKDMVELKRLWRELNPPGVASKLEREYLKEEYYDAIGKILDKQK